MKNDPDQTPQGGPWTRHGHKIPGVTVAGAGRPQVARCGGPELCAACGVDAAAAREPGHGHAPEIDQLRRWKAEATDVLSAWEKVWAALGKPGPLGGHKSTAALEAVQRLLIERDSALANVDHLADQCGAHERALTRERDEHRDRAHQAAFAALDYRDDARALRAERDEARTALAALRGEVEALQADWNQEAAADGNGFGAGRAKCADEIAAVLANHPTTKEADRG